MPNKKALLDAKTKSLFSGRSKEIDLFREYLQNSQEHGLLHVMGIGGIGKTALLEASGNVCNERQIPWVLANVGDQELPSQLLRFVYERLTNTGRLLMPNFRAQIDLYGELDQKVRSDENIPPNMLSIILTGMVRGFVEKKEAKAQQATQALGYLSKLLGGANAGFYLTPSPQFKQALLTDLSEIAAQQQVCLMFDRYELISTYLDEWIRIELFPYLGDNIIVVTSGRKPLPEAWQEWSPILRVLELGPLSTEETKKMIRLRGIADQETIDEIAEFAHGLPLTASIATDLIRENGSVTLKSEQADQHLSGIEQLVIKLVDDTPEDLRGWLEQCAIVRWFNEDTLEQFVGIPSAQVSEVYSRLGNLSLVRPHSNGKTIHDLVRDLICRNLSKRSVQRYIALHNNAASYYRKLTSTAQRNVQPLTVELVYHLLRADQEQGFDRLEELYDNATDFSQADFSAALLDTAKGLAIQTDNKLRLDVFDAVLWQQKNADNLKSSQLLGALVSRPEIEHYPTLKARIASYLSVALWYVCDYPNALKYAQMGLRLGRELNLYKFQNRALEILGLTYNWLGEYEKGIETYLELVGLTQQSSDMVGEGWCLNDLGYIYLDAGKWSQAEAALLKSQAVFIGLNSKYNEVYPTCHLGSLYTAVGRFDDAESTLAHCLSNCKEAKNSEIEGKTLQNLAELHSSQKRFDQAIEEISVAVEISRLLGFPSLELNCLKSWGGILFDCGRIDDSALKYKQCHELAKRLGALYYEMKTQIALQILHLSGWSGEMPATTELVPNTCLRMGYYDLLSNLKFSQATTAINADNLAQGIQVLIECLLYSMLYNRFVLYNRLNQIVQWVQGFHQNDKPEIAYNTLVALREQWATNRHKGQLITEIEDLSRYTEPNLIPLPPKVLDQLDRVLKNFKEVKLNELF